MAYWHPVPLCVACVSDFDFQFHHNEFPLHTQPRRKVLYTECHKPGTIATGGRLYIQSVTGQVLWPLLCSPKGFMPSVLKPNLIFLALFANVGNVLSTFLHCDPSAGCLNILSCLRSFLCRRINLAFVLFMNKHFRHGIRGKYHITLAGTLFLTPIPSTSPGSSQGTLYRHALHTGHESKFSYSPRYRMQSLGQACIFCASNLNFLPRMLSPARCYPQGVSFL